MYSRKENKMAKNIDSFDMDKWSKGKKEKAEKPIKEKKEKETSFDMDDSSSFNVEKFEKKPKKEKAEKPIKEEKESSFEVKSKKEKSFDVAEKGKKIKEKKIKESDDFGMEDDSKKKKKFHFSLKDKKTRIIFISVIATILVLAAILVIVIINSKKGNEPISIYVSEFPETTYYVGEKADYTGLSIAIVKQNGKVDYVKYNEENASQFTFTGFNSSRPYEEQVITVMYNGFSCIYRITVKEIPQTVRELVGVSIEKLPNKTTYAVGEWIDTEGGMLKLEYSDGSTESTILVNNYISGGWEEAWNGGPGTYTIKVKYKDPNTGIVKRTEFEITITE